MDFFETLFKILFAETASTVAGEYEKGADMANNDTGITNWCGPYDRPGNPYAAERRNRQNHE